jgi:PBP1b-binding outer membrane lipoprotein LpoB
MKKISIIILVLSFILVLLGCSNADTVKEDEKYIMNGSVAYGTAENSGLEKTKVSYIMTISGSEEDINNIEAQQPLINEDYMDLLLENGPHNNKIVSSGDESYIEISGEFIFDTEGKTKEEINDMDLFKGIEIYDKDNNNYELIINGYNGE